MIILDKARNIAINTATKLAPYCDRLDIAGSVRRCKFEVHDIEIVCQPKKVSVEIPNLFETRTVGKVTSPEFIKSLKSLGKIVKGNPEGGRFVQLLVPNTLGGPKIIQIDIFMPQQHDYYRMFAIRTGSAAYSQSTIASAWVKAGWCGTSKGLRLEKECKPHRSSEGKIIWTCIATSPTLPPEWKSEAEFFMWLNIPHIHPKLRTV